MSASIHSIWDGKERRRPGSCRRSRERRTFSERRFDPRSDQRRPRRSPVEWFRSLTKVRLGVDRRKNIDNRVTKNRRGQDPRALLTQEEIEALLK